MKNNVIPPTDFLKKIGFKNKKRLKKKNILIPLALVLAVVFTLIGYYYPCAKRLNYLSLSAKDYLLKAQEELKKEDFSQAKEDISQSVNLFSRSNEIIKKFKFLNYIPVASIQYQASLKIFEAGEKTARVLEDLMTIVLSITDPIKSDSRINFASLSDDQKNQTLKTINDSGDDLILLAEEMSDIEKSISSLSESGLLGPIKEAARLIKENVPTLKSGLDEAASLSRLMPVLAGYPGTNSFLFLLQNNTELRPTGGFIGTYGVVRVKNADIISFTADNVYNLDEQYQKCLPPPAPFKKYNKTDCWYLRDSNWSPDFPTAAEKALWFYQQEGGEQKEFKGVIAITPTLIESLIALTGDITVDGVKFTKDNFVDTLEYQVEQGFYQKGLEMSQRKDIIGDLSKVLIDRLYSLPQEKWKDLIDILQSNLRQKQILLYFEDKSVQNIVLEKNWGGAVRATAGDSFLLVDTNLASLKSDPGVKRTINYNLKQEDNKIIAQLQVIYRNEGAFTWKTTRYGSYFRLYVPEGSRLIDIVGTNEEKESVNELGKTYFGSFMTVEPGETVKILFIYELPETIKELLSDKNYNLLVQKQAGAANYDLNLNFEFNRKIKEFSPIDKGKKESNNSLSFKTSLNQDLIFNVNFK
ncbi:MAG: DUF4012 domain-containing protein [Patescibacteria group bacterium]